MAGATVLGVIEPSDQGPRLAYVAGHLPVTPDLLAVAGTVPPTEVFRFAVPCAAGRCRHFDGQDCRLVQRVNAGLAPVVDALPPCAVRKTCRWHAQEGAAACHRCPQVVTLIDHPTAAEARIAGPQG